MKKLCLARSSNRRPVDLKSDTLPLSYGTLHARVNIIVDFKLGVGLKLDNFHSFMNSVRQSSVAQGICLQIQGSSVRTTVLQIFSNVNIIKTSVKIVVKMAQITQDLDKRCKICQDKSYRELSRMARRETISSSVVFRVT